VKSTAWSRSTTSWRSRRRRAERRVHADEERAHADRRARRQPIGPVGDEDATARRLLEDILFGEEAHAEEAHAEELKDWLEP
jgi:bacterioferritin (cytochrome b1)